MILNYLVMSGVITVSFILFSVIDMLGNIPIIINMKKEGLQYDPKVVSIVSALIMISFLFFGTGILSLFGVDISSFALAGSLIMFFIGLEMILGIRFFREENNVASGSIVPLAFPLLAGAGTLTTIISLKSEFDTLSIALGILINVVIIFTLLKSVDYISKRMSEQVATTLRKVFGIILIAIAIQIAKSNL